MPETPFQSLLEASWSDFLRSVGNYHVQPLPPGNSGFFVCINLLPDACRYCISLPMVVYRGGGVLLSTVTASRPEIHSAQLAKNRRLS